MASDISTQGEVLGGCGVTAVGVWRHRVLIAGGSMSDICAQACATCEEPSSHQTGCPLALLSPDDSWCFVENSDSFSGKAGRQRGSVVKVGKEGTGGGVGGHDRCPGEGGRDWHAHLGTQGAGALQSGQGSDQKPSFSKC